jgi:hypothetical protein
MFLTLTNRETVGLSFLCYINYVIYQCYFLNNYCSDSIYHHTAIYSVIDGIWIYMEPESKIPKPEMYIHHLSCFILVLSNASFMHKLGLLLIEFTSLLLLILKLPIPQMLRFALKKILMISWIVLRLLWSPINFHILKVSNLLLDLPINPIDYMSYNVIYLLNLKWTMQVFKVLKNRNHYSSILLSLPIMYIKIPLAQFHAVNLITYSSYVNHAINNHLTNSLDEFAISNCNLVYFDVPYYYSLPISALVSWSKYKYNISVFTRIIYTLSLGYHCMYTPYVVYTLPIILYGFYDMKIGSKNTTSWHLSNGIYMYITSIHQY